MPNTTPNLSLIKPTTNEYFDLAHQNTNMDIIDVALNPTISDSQSPTTESTSGLLSAVVGWLANRIKAITGKTNWYDTPATTLEAVNTHYSSSSSETVKGHVELATAAETTTGTDTTRAVHPAGLKAELDKKINKVGDSMTGALVVTGRGGNNIKTTKDVLTFANSSNTGTLKIMLPFSWTNAMLNLTIKGFSFEGGFSNRNAWELICGGYNALNLWSACSAMLIGKSNFSKVRFAHDGTNCCILIGDLTTVWDNAHITISEVVSGYTGWNIPTTGWSASVITSESGITNVNQTILQSTPLKGTLTIPTTGWITAVGVAPYNWYYDIPLVGALATDKIDIDVTYPYLQQAVVANLGPTEEMVDVVRILAVNIPTATIQARYTIFR